MAFGSFVHGTPRPDSDIDLAVAGLPQDRVLRAMQRVLFEVGRVSDVVSCENDASFVKLLSDSGELRRVA
jgi:predicted nucleotidyltransferase